MSIIIEPIPCFESNYVWLLYNDTNNHAVIVDPGDAKPVMDVLEKKHLSLQTIIITHFHSDHIGGIAELKSKFKCKVIAPLKEVSKIPDVDQTVQQGDVVHLGDIGDAQVIETPGHTLGSICYYIPSLKVVFTGDTLFSMGCGRLFEGTPAQMFESFKKLTALPDDTLVYCAHEYTADNGRFSASLFSHSAPLEARLEEVKRLRESNKPTIPVMLSEEKKTNPFILAKNVDEFAAFRKGKDHFA